MERAWHDACPLKRRRCRKAMASTCGGCLCGLGSKASLDPPPQREAGLDPPLKCTTDLDLPSGHAADLDPSLGRAVGLDLAPNRAATVLHAPIGGAPLGGGGTPLWEDARRRAQPGRAPLGLLSSGGAPRGGEWWGGARWGGEGGDVAGFGGWRMSSG